MNKRQELLFITLVEEYIEVVGKKPFHGWDAETLKEKIEEEKLK